MSQVSTGPAMPAGWYADPSMPGNGRWYDGTAWTNHVHVIPPSAMPTQQGASASGAVAQKLGLAVLGVMGGSFTLGAVVGLPGASSFTEFLAWMLFLLVGLGLLAIVVGSVVAPDKISIRSR